MSNRVVCAPAMSCTSTPSVITPSNSPWSSTPQLVISVPAAAMSANTGWAKVGHPPGVQPPPSTRSSARLAMIVASLTKGDSPSHGRADGSARAGALHATAALFHARAPVGIVGRRGVAGGVESLGLLRREVQAGGAEILVQLRDGSGTEDHRAHRRAISEPGERDLGQ